MKAKGRGSYGVTLEGPLSESGSVTETVTKKKHDGDIEGWCLRRAEELRKGFKEATGAP